MSTINITEAAQTYLSELLAGQDVPGIGIRVFITQPGTTYAETCIAYCKPEDQKAEDTPLTCFAILSLYCVILSSSPMQVIVCNK